MPTFKEFKKIVFGKIKKTAPQSSAPEKTSTDLVKELQTTYQNYQEHMLLKVLPILTKEINSAIEREVKNIDAQIKQLETAIKEHSNQIGQLSRKGNFHGKNTAQIAKQQHASDALREQLKVLSDKRMDLIFAPQRSKLRQINEYMRENNKDMHSATVLAWQLCQEIQTGAPLLSIAAIKSTNDQENIKRFLKVVELNQILKKGPTESIIAFYNVFKNQGGEKAILGDKPRRFFTEKGMVWRKTTELLAKVAVSLNINFETELKKQVAPTSTIHEEKGNEQTPSKLTKK